VSSTSILTRPGATISVSRTGHGPPIVLLHATLSSARDLGPLARRLGVGFTVISVDRRGSGESQLAPGQAPAPVHVATHVDDLAAVIEMEAVGPVTLVGHSYGGCLALELAARRPDLAVRAWVYEPPYAPLGPPEVRDRFGTVGRRTLAAAERGGPAAAAESFLADVAGSEALAGLSPGARERIRRGGTAAIADSALLGLDPEGLEHIGCPVMIATGTASRPAYVAIAEALVRTIPGAFHARIAGADHAAPIVRPAAVAASIEAFAAG
jgi:pimeloyl-ACP methyl ester carboxylesterase